MKSLITGSLLWLALTAAGAQTVVHRCGNSYSQAPCPQSTVIDVADPRSGAQQAGAERVNDDQRRLAAQMHRDRVTDERARRPAAAANLGGAPGHVQPLAAGQVSASAHSRRRSKTSRLATERILVPNDSTAARTPSDSPARNRRAAP